MANTKISALAALTGAGVAADDKFAVVDTSATTSKRIDASELAAYIATANGIPAVISSPADKQVLTYVSASSDWRNRALPCEIGVALSDESTAITTGTGKATIRMPWPMTVTAVRASVNTASSSGLPTVDIKEAGVSILSTLLTINASAKTSTTATTPAVISDASLADDAEITFDITVAGTGAKGLKVWLIGTRA